MLAFKFAFWLANLWLACCAILFGLMLLPPPIYEQVAGYIPGGLLDLLPHEMLWRWASRLRAQ